MSTALSSSAAISLSLLLVAGCTDEREAVTVFHAASLSRVLGELKTRLERDTPGLDLRLEPSGSQVAARKVAELNRPADLVLSADWRVLEQILLPGRADWVLGFASNELVLAYGEHSPFRDELTADNWPVVLQRDGVRLGRADEDTAPLGFQTLQTWELAERALGAQAVGGAGLAARLRARCRPEHVAPDVTELVGLLQARAIDYTFLFRSIAEEHRLPALLLGPAVNLGDASRAASYAEVTVAVRLSDGTPRPLPAEPIIYGLTIPRTAPNPRGALRVALALLGPDGRGLLARSGFTPLQPVRSPQPERLPAALRTLVAPSGEREAAP